MLFLNLGTMAKVISCSKCYRIPKEAAPLLSDLAGKRGRCFREVVNFGRLKEICMYGNSQYFQTKQMCNT